MSDATQQPKEGVSTTPGRITAVLEHDAGAEVTTQGRVTEVVALSTATNVVTKALDKTLIPNWRIAHQLWTVRLSILWAIVSGLWGALPAFTFIFPAHYFVLANIVFAFLILFARLTKQPGVVG